MWGIIPAAGRGTRIQPLAFSKELLPVGGRIDNGTERPRAISEFLIDRLIVGGATKLCFVISSDKSDILEYFGGTFAGIPICYVVQPEPAGLCDAIFRAVPLVGPGESVVIGLPDTIWFPADGLASVPDGDLSFLLFPVDRPSLFDVVIADGAGNVQRIDVKPSNPESSWVWGSFKMPETVMTALFDLWLRRGGIDEYFGTLVNAYLAEGGRARAFRNGRIYVDVGTLDGCRQAARLLQSVGEIPAFI
jgi:glucose-1-phosphate thymidylyltransferase